MKGSDRQKQLSPCAITLVERNICPLTVEYSLAQTRNICYLSIFSIKMIQRRPLLFNCQMRQIRV